MSGTIQSQPKISAAPPPGAEGPGAAAFRALADNLPVAAYLCDLDGLITYYNEPAVRLWGRRPKLNDASEKYCGSFRLRLSDGTPIDHAKCLMAETLRTGVAQKGMEVVIEREDGSSAYALAHSAPVCDATGRIIGASNVLVDVTDRWRAKEAFESVIASLAPKTGHDYFRSLVDTLCKICKTDYAFVARVDAGVPYQVNTIAVSRRGEAMENFAYDLRGTPCANVAGKQMCFHPSEIQKSFPEDKLLADMGIESYLGAPLFSSTRESLGILVMLHSSPIENPEMAMAILKAVGARAGAEMERERAGLALRESEARLAAVISHSPGVAVQWYSPEGRVLLWNRASEEMFGFKAEEALGKTLDQLIHTPEETAAFVATCAEIARTGQPVGPVEYTFKRRSGEQGACLSTVFRIPGTDGGDWFVCMDIDITGRKRMEESLRESETRFRLFMDNNPAGAFVKDDARRYVYVSAAFERLIGLPREGILGKRDDEIFPQAAADEIWAEDLRALQLGAVHAYHKTFHRAGRDPLHVWIHKFPFVDAQSRRFLAGIAIDEAERVRAEEENRKLEDQMRHAQKLESLGVLAGGIAHDFNNLLTAVLGHASLAAMDLPPGSPAVASLGEIESAVEQAADLTRQMLAYSGRGKFVVKTLALDGVVREMSKLLSTAVSKKATFQSDLATAPIEADATQIRQVVMNLITNASEALGDRPGSIMIRTGVREMNAEALVSPFLHDPLPGGQYAFIEVADTGCGMDNATLGKIFDPFFTTKFTGRGLGLAATLGIVRGHRGTLQVKSAPGEGTTFTVYIPISAGGDITDEAASGDRALPRAGRGMILVIEDEEPVQRVALLALERAGFEVLLASDGEAGIEMFQRRREEIAGVLLDLTMPRKDGWETLALIQSASPGMPVLLMSGYNEPEAPSHIPLDQRLRFIQKPFGPAELIDRISEIVSSER